MTWKPPAPTKQQILDFINESPGPVGKREIARIALKAVLKELQNEGLLDRGAKRRVRPAGALPPVAVIDVIEIDADGDVLCRPARWESDFPPPAIYLRAGRKAVAAPSKGIRVLARLKKVPDGGYDAEIIRILGSGPRVMIGVYARRGAHGVIRPTSRGRMPDYTVAAQHRADARDGDVVVAEALPAARGLDHRAQIIERLGPIDDPATYSLIAIHSREIPVEFSPDAMAIAAAAGPRTLEKRTDLRDLALVTIDGADARDYDDAVWAKKDENGWQIIVAIADVAAYVRPGDALDRDAYERGTSVYFPDRVVPMLPEAISNGWCSLLPHEDRPCVAVRLAIGPDGALRSHEFIRATMRSAARLTYEQVQQAQDGAPDADTAPLAKTVIAPLYGAYKALLKAREARGTLDLDLPELAISLGQDGHVAAIAPRPRLDSHRLIEEFMIAANVAAAQSLQALGAPVMYRAHEAPAMDKLEALRQSLGGLGYKLVKGAVRPASLSGILAQAVDQDDAPLVNQLILRSQSKAVYGPDNPGHFGLALSRYCHFTSPIRRYPDLLIHRALIAAHRLGDDGLPPDSGDKYTDMGLSLSQKERRAEAAEREARARYMTAYLADRIGARFSGRISGVTRFGLFVTLDDIGADGLIPISTLPQDYYDHDDVQNRLVGRDTGQTFTLGEAVQITLYEANTNTGGLVFHLLDGGVRPARRARGKTGPVRRGTGRKMYRKRKPGRPRR